jgi:5,10-methylene-tetrahydrofolate dehydrogenase/methenyl tetrahydrofolate cyclohydrolase
VCSGNQQEGKIMKKATQSLLALAATGAGLWLAARALKRRQESCDLRGKSVLITGGSRGLGLVLGREFVREGARVAICARDTDARAPIWHHRDCRCWPFPAISQSTTKSKR